MTTWSARFAETSVATAPPGVVPAVPLANTLPAPSVTGTLSNGNICGTSTVITVPGATGSKYAHSTVGCRAGTLSAMRPPSIESPIGPRDESTVRVLEREVLFLGLHVDEHDPADPIATEIGRRRTAVREADGQAQHAAGLPQLEDFGRDAGDLGFDRLRLGNRRHLQCRNEERRTIITRLLVAA